MSLLSDYSIHHVMRQRRLQVVPFRAENLGPASLDVTLASRHLRPDPEISHIDVADVPEGHMVEHRADDEGRILLAPGEFILGSTCEMVRLDGSLAARYEGRSSIGRLGITSHVTAGFIDPGFSGFITLEIVNHAPYAVTLRAGMRIGQLAFFRTSTPVLHVYGEQGRYQDQVGAQESRFRLDVVSAVV